MSNLIELDLRDNNLEKIPSSVLNLEKLEKLDLRWNKNLKVTKCLIELEERGCIVYK
ncbi:leucine-rich repeat domain-containing protein [Brevibacterium sp. JNUCC-42]|nr:leucine-rich repeat domain-containing protein [Brevibacterium sp. JNUCC-42]